MTDRGIKILGGVLLGILVMLIAAIAFPEMTAHLFAPIEVPLLRRRARLAAKPADRAVAVYALVNPHHGEFPPDYATAIAVLQTDPDPGVRCSVAEDLYGVRVRPDSAEGRALMREVLAALLQQAESDPDPAVREACLDSAFHNITSLVALERPPAFVREHLDSVMDGLVTALSDPDQSVRTTARENISLLQGEGLVPEPPETTDAKVWQEWLQTWREERGPPAAGVP